jgi:hypothetical protein
MLTALLPALAALLAVTTACSSKSNDGNTSGGNTTNNNKSDGLPACPTAATIKTELGLDVKEATIEGNAPVRVCQFAPGGTTGSAIVRFQGKEDAQQFATAKQIFKDSGQPVTDVTGLGDEAYSSTLGSSKIVINTIVARKGSLEVLITSQASLEQEKAFAAKLLG